jgi:hypothetical protein
MILGALVALAIAFVIAMRIGSRQQQRTLAAGLDRLIRAGAERRANIQFRSLGLESVPAPVARYLRLALPSPIHVQQVRMQQVGALRVDVNSERWRPFEAEHVVVPAATGFVWNARIRIAPLIHVRVRDTLVDGRGAGRVSLLSSFTVAEDAGTPRMNFSSLHRYLAEAVWYPMALLPSPQLAWTEIDEKTALATLTTHGVTVSLEFRFASGGEVAGIYSPGRWGTSPGRYPLLEWEGHFRDYREREGIVVPSEGDVGWHVDKQWHAVWKGRITSFELHN